MSVITCCKSQNKEIMTDFQKAQEIQQKIVRGDLMIGILDAAEIDIMIDLYKKSNDPASWYELGMIYYRGIGVEQDAEKAINYFELAAESGYGIAAWIKYIRIAYFVNLTFISSDKIISLIEKLEKEDVSGEVYLLKGYMLYNGYAYKENFESSLLAHQESAKKGNTDAMFELYVYHSMGIGVEENLNIALDWCIKAAENDNARAIYNLGTYYATGYENITKDIKKAVNYYKRAASLSHGKAAGQLAAMYTMGDELEKNNENAKKYYKMAIENDFEVDILFEDLGLEEININD